MCNLESFLCQSVPSAHSSQLYRISKRMPRPSGDRDQHNKITILEPLDPEAAHRRVYLALAYPPISDISLCFTVFGKSLLDLVGRHWLDNLSSCTLRPPHDSTENQEMLGWQREQLFTDRLTIGRLNIPVNTGSRYFRAIPFGSCLPSTSEQRQRLAGVTPAMCGFQDAIIGHLVW